MNRIEQQQKPGWVEHLKTHLKGAERTCCHVLAGRIDAPKICPLSYECFHCAFDQLMDDFDLAQLSRPTHYSAAASYN